MLIIYVVFTSLAALAYLLLIISILENWRTQEMHPATTTLNFSVIIPARNESKKIFRCLNSVIDSADNYKGIVEIIVIDDHSQDDTFKIVEDFCEDYNVRVYKLSQFIDGNINAYKKAAINFGLQKSKYEYIVQLDADVDIDKLYFATINNWINSKKAHFLAGPVLFAPSKNLLEHFQTLDMMGMMAVTNAGIYSQKWYMANGANMIYKKGHDEFDNNAVASGDDVFKIQSFAKGDKSKITFCLDRHAIVQTAPENSWKSLYKQRIRWATKNKKMNSTPMQVMMFIPFINALLIIGHLFLIFWFGISAVVLFLFHILIKLGIDYVYLKKLSLFFKQESSIKYFLQANLIHVFYIAFIGLASLFVRKYKWKGRSVR